MTACSAPDRRRTAATCPEDQLGRLTACWPFSRAIREVAGKFIRSAAYPPVRPAVQDDRVDDGRHEVLLEHAAMIRLARRHAAVLCLAGTGRLSAVGKSQRAGEESVHHKSKNRP